MASSRTPIFLVVDVRGSHNPTVWLNDDDSVTVFPELRNTGKGYVAESNEIAKASLETIGNLAWLVGLTIDCPNAELLQPVGLTEMFAAIDDAKGRIMKELA